MYCDFVRVERWRKCNLPVMVTALIIGLCGCGSTEGTKTVQTVPELREPVSRSDSLCKVAKGTVGIPEVLFASVVPLEKEHSYDSSVRLKKIVVQVGDEVKKGDVLAYIDNTEMRDSLKESQKEYEREKKSYERGREIASQQMEQCRLERKAGMISAKEMKKQLAVLRENMRYDKLLHEKKVNVLDKKIKAQKKNLNKSVLKSKCEGIVSYVKDISDVMPEENAVNDMGDIYEDAVSDDTDKTWADAGETIVTVSPDLREDMSDACLEVSDVKLNAYAYEDYEKKVLRDGSREYELSEVSYPEKERMIFAATEKYPKLRFECSDKMKKNLVPGETYPLYFYKEKKEETLVIPEAALVEENAVYVRAKNNIKERRELTLGKSDGCMVEVAGGLSEGEEVYCQYDNGIPDMTDQQPVAVRDYTVYSKGRSMQTTHAMLHICYSELSGRVTDVSVKKGDRVKKGQLLYTVDTGDGKARLTEMKYQIQGEKTSFEKNKKSFEKEKKLVRKRWKKNKKMMQCEMKILACQFEADREEYEETLTELEKEYKEIKNGNNGTGEVSVYADRSGQVKGCFVEKGDALEEGQYSVVLRVKEAGVPAVKKSDGKEEAVLNRLTPVFGALVTWKSKEGEKKGICVGVKDEGDFSENPVYYVKEEEGKTAGNVSAAFAYVTLHHAVVVPANKIHTEDEKSGVTGYYVWRVVDGGAVKQSVVVRDDLAAKGYQVILYGIREGDRIC